jgi:uncharacterized protein YkwD
MNKQTKSKIATHAPLRQFVSYLPALAVFGVGVFFSSKTPTAHAHTAHKVLAYATSMSVSDLLAQTNTQRAANGSPALQLNSKLVSAAQAKANDMVARNYWSHNTPDGQEPWVFFQNAGYAYKKAGENLAYGFDTSAYVINGWMNSPPHRANMLDADFQEVGFGFANSSNYVSSGPETVVVAEYGQPVVPIAAPAPTPTPAPAPTTTTPAPPPASHAPTASQPSASAAPTTAITTPSSDAGQSPAPAAATPSSSADTSNSPKSEPIATSQDGTDTPEAEQAHVSRLQIITHGSARWSIALTAAAIPGTFILWGLHHLIAVRRAMAMSHHFILHHFAFDLFMASCLVTALLMHQSLGVIR